MKETEGDPAVTRRAKEALAWLKMHSAKSIGTNGGGDGESRDKGKRKAEEISGESEEERATRAEDTEAGLESVYKKARHDFQGLPLPRELLQEIATYTITNDIPSFLQLMSAAKGGNPFREFILSGVLSRSMMTAHGWLDGRCDFNRLGEKEYAGAFGVWGANFIRALVYMIPAMEGAVADLDGHAKLAVANDARAYLRSRTDRLAFLASKLIALYARAISEIYGDEERFPDGRGEWILARALNGLGEIAASKQGRLAEWQPLGGTFAEPPVSGVIVISETFKFARLMLSSALEHAIAKTGAPEQLLGDVLVSDTWDPAGVTAILDRPEFLAEIVSRIRARPTEALPMFWIAWMPSAVAVNVLQELVFAMLTRRVAPLQPLIRTDNIVALGRIFNRAVVALRVHEEVNKAFTWTDPAGTGPRVEFSALYGIRGSSPFVSTRQLLSADFAWAACRLSRGPFSYPAPLSAVYNAGKHGVMDMTIGPGGLSAALLISILQPLQKDVGDFWFRAGRVVSPVLPVHSRADRIGRKMTRTCYLLSDPTVEGFGRTLTPVLARLHGSFPGDPSDLQVDLLIKARKWNSVVKPPTRLGRPAAPRISRYGKGEGPTPISVHELPRVASGFSLAPFVAERTAVTYGSPFAPSASAAGPSQATSTRQASGVITLNVAIEGIGLDGARWSFLDRDAIKAPVVYDRVFYPVPSRLSFVDVPFYDGWIPNAHKGVDYPTKRSDRHAALSVVYNGFSHMDPWIDPAEADRRRRVYDVIPAPDFLPWTAYPVDSLTVTGWPWSEEGPTPTGGQTRISRDDLHPLTGRHPLPEGGNPFEGEIGVQLDVAGKHLDLVATAWAEVVVLVWYALDRVEHVSAELVDVGMRRVTQALKEDWARFPSVHAVIMEKIDVNSRGRRIVLGNDQTPTIDLGQLTPESISLLGESIAPFSDASFDEAPAYLRFRAFDNPYPFDNEELRAEYPVEDTAEQLARYPDADEAHLRSLLRLFNASKWNTVAILQRRREILASRGGTPPDATTGGAIGRSVASGRARDHARGHPVGHLTSSRARKILNSDRKMSVREKSFMEYVAFENARRSGDMLAYRQDGEAEKAPAPPPPSESDAVGIGAALHEEVTSIGAKKGSSHGHLTAEKARKMAHEGTAHGRPITDAQRRYFWFVAKGGRPTRLGDQVGDYYDTEIPEPPEGDVVVRPGHPNIGEEVSVPFDDGSEDIGTQLFRPACGYCNRPSVRGCSRCKKHHFCSDGCRLRSKHRCCGAP